MAIQIFRVFFLAVLIFASPKIFAQDFPNDIFDTWAVNRELNACGSDITGDTLWGAGVFELVLKNMSEDQIIDTTQLILKYTTGIVDTCIFELNSQPDSANWISATNAHCFDPISWININMLADNSLHFHWLTPCNACSCGGTYQAKRKSSSSVSKQDSSDSWTIYPNPASDEIFIQKKGNQLCDDLKICLTNSLGMPLLTFEPAQSDFDFSIKEFAAGVYYLVILEGENLTVKKVLKF